jgi:hypothetical protein
MGLAGGKLSTVAVAALLALFVASCGGGDDDSGASDSTSAAQGQEGATGEAAQSEKDGASKSKQSDGSGQSGGGSSGSKPKTHDDSGGGSAQFKTKGGDNSVQEFGKESSQSEFDQAAEAVHGFFDARVAGDWKAACSHLAKDVSKSLEQLAGKSKELADGGCAKTLEAISAGVPRSAFVEAAEADIGSLRVEGDRAFVVYRGAENTVYAMPMKDEGGAWKVASLAGTPLN